MLIAQITDLHIRMPGQKAYRVVETDRCLPPAIGALNALDPPADLVIISGDLTDFGRPEEYAHLRGMLDGLRAPYFLLPGNHDVRQNVRAAFSDTAHLQDKLQSSDEFLHYTIEEHPLRIIVLDTTVPAQSYGTLCDRRLAWLADRLAEQPGRPTLIAMHHPPFAVGIDHMDAIGLREGADELERLVSRYPNIERIICGHVHRTIFRRFGGALVSICPGPAHHVALDLRALGPSAFVMEPPAYHVHLYRGGSLVTHHAYIGAYPGPYPFHEEDGAQIDE